MKVKFSPLLILTFALLLSGCGATADAIENTARAFTGTIQKTKDLKEDVEGRVERINDGIEAVQSGASLIKSGLK